MREKLRISPLTFTCCKSIWRWGFSLLMELVCVSIQENEQNHIQNHYWYLQKQIGTKLSTHNCFWEILILYGWPSLNHSIVVIPFIKAITTHLLFIGPNIPSNLFNTCCLHFITAHLLNLVIIFAYFYFCIFSIYILWIYFPSSVQKNN